MTRTRSLALGFAAFVGLYLMVNLTLTKRNLSGDFGSEEIKSVQIGMTLEEVVDILGMPYSIESLRGLHDLSCANPHEHLEREISSDTDIRFVVDSVYSDYPYCCSGNFDDRLAKHVTLVYSKRVEFSAFYPMLWIHLDSRFCVSSVFAKRYTGILGLDDPAIYSWDGRGFFIDEIRFKQCFDQ